MRILGIDYGSKRVGVAVSDEGNLFALPLTTIVNSDVLLAEIKKLALDQEVKEIVLGESRNYKNEPNAIWEQSVEFKHVLEHQGFTVHFEPEFMTSAHVEKLQGKTDKVDASAAALILQSFLDRRRNSQNP